MLIPFGVLSAAGAGGVAGTYELIETQILGSSQSSITFSNLGTYSSTYRHLQIRYTARNSSTNNQTFIRFNADTGSNYARHILYGDGNSVRSEATTSQTSGYVGQVFPSTGTANGFAAAVIDILDVYGNKNKTVRSLSGEVGSPAYVTLHSSLWMSTASVTSITLLTSGNNYVANSRFSLYGIR